MAQLTRRGSLGVKGWRNDFGLPPVLSSMVVLVTPSDVSKAHDKEQGDEAFATFVLPEIDVLYRTAWSLTRNKADADDLVQDTLLRAYRAIDRFDGRYPRAWLMTIMRNANINRARKKTPDLLDDPDLTFERSTDFADHDGPEARVIDPMFDAVIDEAFAQLPEKFRAVVELVDINGLPYQQAAELLGVPVGTVMSRLHRGRKRIRDHIGSEGLDVSGAFRYDSTQATKPSDQEDTK